MTSLYEENIPPGWDRSDPAGSLIDITTGGPIRNVDHNGGWIRLPDGTAVRDDDPAFNPAMRLPLTSATTNVSVLLLLFS
jgi:hypothetical protein